MLGELGQKKGLGGEACALIFSAWLTSHMSVWEGALWCSLLSDDMGRSTRKKRNSVRWEEGRGGPGWLSTQASGATREEEEAHMCSSGTPLPSRGPGEPVTR